MTGPTVSGAGAATATALATLNNSAEEHLQQYSACAGEMPAVPQEKATAVSLNENNFSELKYKELASSGNTIAATMATTATASNNSRLHQQNAHIHHHRNTCGCGAASAAVESDNCSGISAASPTVENTRHYNGVAAVSSSDVVDGLQQQRHHHHHHQQQQNNKNNNNNHIANSSSMNYLLNGKYFQKFVAKASLLACFWANKQQFH